MNPPVKQFRKRNAILAYLKETKEHPSAEMVFTHLKPEIPDLSLGTVYRNLTKFREQGDIISLGAVNGVERFDGNNAGWNRATGGTCSVPGNRNFRNAASEQIGK